MKIRTTTFNGLQMTTDTQSRISLLIGIRSDAIRLQKVPVIIPLESYNLHFPLNFEIIIDNSKIILKNKG